jgi:hypothetical protein
MADVEYSLDGGSTWETPVGDAWPTESGRHIVRLEFREAPYSRRVMVRVSGTDADTYQVRSITVKGKRLPQEMSLSGGATSPVSTVKPRRFSQEAEPTVESGELAVWYKPTTGQVWLVYNDAAAGNVLVELD